MGRRPVPRGAQRSPQPLFVSLAAALHSMRGGGGGECVLEYVQTLRGDELELVARHSLVTPARTRAGERSELRALDAAHP